MALVESVAAMVAIMAALVALQWTSRAVAAQLQADRLAHAAVWMSARGGVSATATRLRSLLVAAGLGDAHCSTKAGSVRCQTPNALVVLERTGGPLRQRNAVTVKHARGVARAFSQRFEFWP